VVSLLIAGASLLLPWDTTYDPWAWIVWGREIAHLQLHTTSGPSWKPLPVLFTTPFSLAGDAAPALWLAVARASGLLALAAAYAAGRRLGGPVAAAGAALALVLNLDFFRVVWLGSSEGMLVAALLVAVERHVAGAHRTAFGFGVAAALLRPEVWPFLGAYGLWLFMRDPRARGLVAASAALIAVLWLAPEYWGSGQLFRAAERATQPVAAAATFAPNPALAVVRRMDVMLFGPIQAAAVVAVAFALAPLRRRRDWMVIGIAVLAGSWLVLVAAMTANGFSGNSRYVMAPAALAALLAGVGAARAAEVVGALMRRARAVPTLAAALSAGLLAAGFLPFAAQRAHQLVGGLAVLEYQAKLRSGLREAVDRVGGRAAVLACGSPVTEDYSVPMLAWLLDVPIGSVGIGARPDAIVFQAAPGPKSHRDPLVRGAGLRARFRSGPFRVYAPRVCAHPSSVPPGNRNVYGSVTRA
jgi:hypothetical protein